ncbi:unnamed protein product [Fusarium graminearum]|nr:unnamed protein product [Fusarium graminearum]
MHFSGLLLTLAATISAIDIRGWTSDGCRGSFRACIGIDPRLCCIFSETSSSGRYSVSVNAVRGYYYFPTLKRAVNESCPVEQPEGGKCKASVKPNALGLKDGTIFCCREEEIAVAGATADAVPVEFKILSI